MTANFTQVVMSSDGTTLQQSTGTMAISRPGKFRWETLTPMKQSIVTNGQTVWIYDPALQQVVIRKLNQSISQTPILLLTQTHVYLQNSFNITQIKGNQIPRSSRGMTDSTSRGTTKNEVSSSRGLTAGSQWFSLTPKKSGEVFNQVILGFTNNQITHMQFSNQLGQKTIVKFSKVKTDVTIPSSQFTFKAPKGVDIVKE